MKSRIWLIAALAIALLASGCKNDVEGTKSMSAEVETFAAENSEYAEPETEESQVCQQVYLVSEIVFENVGLGKSRVTYKYDDQNRVIEQCSEDASNRTVWHYEYTEGGYSTVSSYGDVTDILVNENGDELQISSYDLDGQITGRTNNVYNDSGELVEVRRYNSDGLETVREIYVYDEEGRKLSAVKYEINYDTMWDDSECQEFGVNYIHRGTATTSLFYYDENGRLIEQRDVVMSNASYGWDANDGIAVDCNIYDTFTYKYDYSEDHVITVIQYDTAGKEYCRTTEKFDSAGNCIERKYDYSNENMCDSIINIKYIPAEEKTKGAK